MTTAFPTASRKELTLWLWVLLISVSIAGFFAFFLAAGRTPGVAAATGVADIFGVSLVVHVDLSVLLWFLGISALTWNLLIPSDQPRFWLSSLAMRFGAGCFLAAIFFIAIAPWNGGEVIKSNYVPMITNAVFYLGLALLAMGTLLAGFATLPALLVPRSDWNLPVMHRTYVAAVGGSVLIVLFCILGLAHVAPQLNRALGDDLFFERLYWGPGHLLQFANVQTMMLVWLVLASAAGLVAFANKRLHFWLFITNAIVGLAALPTLFTQVPDEETFVIFFTKQMQWVGGLVPALAVLLLLPQLGALWKNRRDTSAVALLVSVSVFLVGGFFGLMIVGSNTTVPGHYHGAIGGITAGIMGFIYLMLPRAGYADVRGWKSARVQLWIYGAGQVVHASALALSGGYGALRKTVETGEMTAGAAMFAKGMIGLGGGLAIIGGIMFVVVVIRSMKNKSTIPMHTSV